MLRRDDASRARTDVNGGADDRANAQCDDATEHHVRVAVGEEVGRKINDTVIEQLKNSYDSKITSEKHIPEASPEHPAKQSLIRFTTYNSTPVYDGCQSICRRIMTKNTGVPSCATRRG